MRFWFGILFICCGLYSYSQLQLRDDEELIPLLETDLRCIYNNEFDRASEITIQVEKKVGNHPVVSFLKGLIVYWRNDPLMHQSEDEEAFLMYMEECMKKSDKTLKANSEDLEAIFFSLISRGMLMLHYADNDLSRKVIPYAREAYKLTLSGSKRKDEFIEFYFISGLYNYYRVAYPEAHPVYKPLLIIFKAGNKEKGIEQLKDAIENTVFLRVESMLYLSYIYLHYENDPLHALALAEKLYKEFPNNKYFLARYTELLLLNDYYVRAIPYIKNLITCKENLYSIMKGFVFKGIIEEKVNMDYTKARKNYETGIQIADEYESWGDIYKAYAYKGLSRISKSEGDDAKMKEYERLAKKNATYAYIKNWE